ncbi:SDR family oxidoreductase [Novosphingobium pentaromativorans]|uniref:NAD(P)-binding domain-containing protein n=1 Tax=Novosphingobium pentaromativorans US6-1 TaxID=1088721 RepID=G6EGL2_9SPHN|nr:NAD(P)H-binding protein [Novosphingobium pentaromativorans]AIT82160.1 hypothetical protein JI59_21785 [Novosphingobium pentaromativorans US6-1]EHJ59559.1 hypothetical protein NSU_3442 [Novosphingobium pentaromativorans US6-1]
MKILLTAAAGHQGKLLLPKLSALGHTVRAARATPGKDDELLALGASEVFVGDLTEVDTYTRALEDCDAVYHVGPAGIARETDYGLAMIEAARRNGTRHVVMSSVYHTIIDIVQHRWKRDIEEKLFESGLNCTVLRPCDFMVVEHYIDIPLRTGVLPMFWNIAGERRGSMIAIDDLTDVAAKVLTEGSRHYFANYELAGPDKLNAHEIARILSRVMAKPIAVEEQSPEQFMKRNFGLEEISGVWREYLDVISSISAWYSKHDFVGNPNVLEWLLGRPATNFETFARKQVPSTAS